VTAKNRSRPYLAVFKQLSLASGTLDGQHKNRGIKKQSLGVEDFIRLILLPEGLKKCSGMLRKRQVPGRLLAGNT
jgi:hypothetical protein